MGLGADASAERQGKRAHSSFLGETVSLSRACPECK